MESKDDKRRIKVVVRVRPEVPCDLEISRSKNVKHATCVNISSDENESKNHNYYKSLTIEKDKFHSKEFSFHDLLGPQCSQEEVYVRSCWRLVKGAVEDGQDGCVMCYGQSGSGKTFTMLGEKDFNGARDGSTFGLLQYSLRDVFRLINESNRREEEYQWKVEASFYEIYLEKIYDLLAPPVNGKKFSSNYIPSSPNKGTVLANLTKIPIDDIQAGLRLIKRIARKRSSRKSYYNRCSSRSHGIFLLMIGRTQLSRGTDIDNCDNRCSVLTFCDLAGSERGSTLHSPSRQESQFINKSIYALGSCIQSLYRISRQNALVWNPTNIQKHIPFRDSILTFILIDSLSKSTTQTSVVCTVNPMLYGFSESVCTLKFGYRAAAIRKREPSENFGRKNIFDDNSLNDWKWEKSQMEICDRFEPSNQSIDDKVMTVDEFINSVSPKKKSFNSLTSSDMTSSATKNWVEFEEHVVNHAVKESSSDEDCLSHKFGTPNLACKIDTSCLDTGYWYKRLKRIVYIDENSCATVDLEALFQALCSLEQLRIESHQREESDAFNKEMLYILSLPKQFKSSCTHLLTSQVLLYVLTGLISSLVSLEILVSRLRNGIDANDTSLRKHDDDNDASCLEALNPADTHSNQENKSRTVREQNAMLESQVASQKDTIAELDEAIQVGVGEVHKLEEELEMMEAAHALALEDNERRVAVLEEELSRREDEIADVMQGSSRKDEQIAELEASLVDMAERGRGCPVVPAAQLEDDVAAVGLEGVLDGALLRCENSRLEAVCGRLRAQCSARIDEMASLSNAVEELGEKMRDLESEREHHVDEISRLERFLAENEREMGRYDASVCAAEEESRTVREQNAMLESQVASQKETIAELDEAIQVGVGEVHKLEEELEMMEAAHALALEDNERRVAVLEEELSRREDEIADVMQGSSRKDEQIAELEASLVDMAERGRGCPVVPAAQLEDDVAAVGLEGVLDGALLRCENSRLEAVCGRLRAQCSARIDEMASLSNAVEELGEKMRDLESEREHHVDEISRLERFLAENEREMGRYDASVCAAEEESRTVREQNAMLESQVASQKETIAELDEAIQVGVGEVHKLEEELEMMEAAHALALEDNERRVAVLEEELMGSNVQLREFRDYSSALALELKNLKSYVVELETSHKMDSQPLHKKLNALSLLAANREGDSFTGEHKDDSSVSTLSSSDSGFQNN